MKALRFSYVAIALTTSACSSVGDASPENAPRYASMPSSLPAPPRGACVESTTPTLCGPLVVKSLSDELEIRADMPRRRAFGDPRPANEPPRRNAPIVYEGLLAIGVPGTYAYRVEGADDAWLYFDDPRHLVRHVHGASAKMDVDLSVGPHSFWLIVVNPLPELAVLLRRTADSAGVEQIIEPDPRVTSRDLARDWPVR